MPHESLAGRYLLAVMILFLMPTIMMLISFIHVSERQTVSLAQRGRLVLRQVLKVLLAISRLFTSTFMATSVSLTMFCVVPFLQALKRTVFEARAARELYGLEESASSPQATPRGLATSSVTRPRLNSMAEKIKQGRRTMRMLDQSVSGVGSEVFFLSCLNPVLHIIQNFTLTLTGLFSYLGAEVRNGFPERGGSHQRAGSTVRVRIVLLVIRGAAIIFGANLTAGHTRGKKFSMSDLHLCLDGSIDCLHEEDTERKALASPPKTEPISTPALVKSKVEKKGKSTRSSSMLGVQAPPAPSTAVTAQVLPIKRASSTTTVVDLRDQHTVFATPATNFQILLPPTSNTGKPPLDSPQPKEHHKDRKYRILGNVAESHQHLGDVGPSPHSVLPTTWSERQALSPQHVVSGS
jgi:hypothetical protein